MLHNVSSIFLALQKQGSERGQLLTEHLRHEFENSFMIVATANYIIVGVMFYNALYGLNTNCHMSVSSVACSLFRRGRCKTGAPTMILPKLQISWKGLTFKVPTPTYHHYL